jgi:hypothetical protein
VGRSAAEQLYTRILRRIQRCANILCFLNSDNFGFDLERQTILLQYNINNHLENLHFHENHFDDFLGFI